MMPAQFVLHIKEAEVAAFGVVAVAQFVGYGGSAVQIAQRFVERPEADDMIFAAEPLYGILPTGILRSGAIQRRMPVNQLGARLMVCSANTRGRPKAG